MPTPDTHLMIHLRGAKVSRFMIRGRWLDTRDLDGDVTLVAGGADSGRMGQVCDAVGEVCHVIISASVVQDAADLLRPAGRKTGTFRLRSLFLNDSSMVATCKALVSGAENRLPSIYAEQAVNWLVTHTLAVHGGSGYDSRRRRSSRATDAQLDRVIDMIKNSYDQHLSLDKLADEAGISKFHLVRLFRERTGLTPAAYVERTRISKAQRLLVDDDLSIAEISRLIGYHGADQFSAAFKRIRGVPPSAFRQQVRRRT